MSNLRGEQDKMVKLLIIGDSGVGKTCLLMRFCENMFTNNHLTTIGIDFKIKTMEIDGRMVKLQIWDTAGQERFRTITQTYYKGAQGIILTYGVDDKTSFQSIENWMKQIRTHAQEHVCRILVGNKSDTTDRVVETVEGQKLADEYGIPFFETSAKAGINVQQIFTSIGRLCLDKSQPAQQQSGQSLSLQSRPNQEEKKSSCC